ncbi:hypothetical protein [Mycobacterium bourgelatii]|uniref:Uncharacterized protein n=1 Tax=Mycobacterium bourgelatii TaxID=1273442 RepID=A0A7I9YN65_MYCBU|nr:hypothetical protein [Mycobacterium bourgelatii]MCV6977590.1 hypothetical protein [Mycobacterium bourgelatii]GFG89943.1 hypothetical protein MBOU_19850 [Mycobacterium bourgelatii]
MDEMGDALRMMSGASRSYDFSDLRAACRELNRANDRLKALLPSPDSQVTAEVQAAIKSFDQVSKMCMGAS